MQDCGGCEHDIITVYVSGTLSSFMLIYFETQQENEVEVHNNNGDKETEAYIFVLRKTHNQQIS